MADFSPIKNIVDDALALDLANPNFAISEKEKILRDAAIRLGTLDYYRCFPMQTKYVTTYSTAAGSSETFSWTGIKPPRVENGCTYVPFEDLLTGCVPAIPEDHLDNAYFLGVIKTERPYFGNFSNPSTFSVQFFQWQVSSNLFSTDPLTMLANNTYDELSTGQPSYTIDRTQNRLIIFPPFGLGQISFTLALAFTSPEYVEMSKVDKLCHFISYRFIESIIQARSGVEFDADFTISTKALEVRLASLKEKIDSYRNHSIFSLAYWS